MKHKNTVGQAGLLFLVLLRRAHTLSTPSRSRSLPVRFGETISWSQTVVNLNETTAAEELSVSPSCPGQGAQTALPTAEPREL